jgi:hypothetical protein
MPHTRGAALPYRIGHSRRIATKLSYPRKRVMGNRAAPYAVARCCSWCPSRTLTTLETPGSCMVTP